MTPFFSIIIPVYNVAPYLRECLDSVLAQTFTDWEAICVDDGSTDGSGAILDEYAAKDKRFRVFHQSNAGVSAARNRAIKEAMGGWILFLDGDDVWAFSLLNELYSCIYKTRDVPLVRFGYKPFTDKCPSFASGKATWKYMDISHGMSHHDFFFFFFFCYAYRQDVIKDIYFPLYVRGEDRVFLAHIQFERASMMLCCDEIFYGYRQRLGSAMQSTPSYKAIESEMLHRCDLVRIIDGSEKKVCYGNEYWVTTFFGFTFFRWIKSLSSSDQYSLVRIWFECVELLCHAKELNPRYRVAYRLSVKCHSVKPVFILCYIWHWWYIYSYSLRGYRRVKRLFQVKNRICDL